MPKQTQTFISHNGLQSDEYVFSWVGVPGETNTQSFPSTGGGRNCGIISTKNGNPVDFNIISGSTFSWGTVQKVNTSSYRGIAIGVNANTPLGDRSHTVVIQQDSNEAEPLTLTLVINQEKAKINAVMNFTNGSIVLGSGELSFNMSLVDENNNPVYDGADLKVYARCKVNGEGEVIDIGDEGDPPYLTYPEGAQIPYQKDITIMLHTSPPQIQSVEVEITTIDPSADSKYNYNAGEPLIFNF